MPAMARWAKEAVSTANRKDNRAVLLRASRGVYGRNM